DRDAAIGLLRRAVELGVELIDTAASYGPYVSEELICQALHPYPENLLIATKSGSVRTGPEVYVPLGRPEFIRQDCEMSLRRLKLERIDLFQLHMIDPKVSLDDQFGVLAELKAEGKVGAVGLSSVTVEQVRHARSIVEVASVQNEYNLAQRRFEEVVAYCEQEDLGFMPFWPLALGELARRGGTLAGIATEVGATTAQVSLAWLLAHSPVMLPIPGTTSTAHLEQNCAAAAVELSSEQLARLDALALG
ncbi:MAG TPA: aldo/keto reductase, partial [Thermoleophilia bacterium]|nr:aldo/keto reductase [Thermoleophilia bacterium]